MRIVGIAGGTASGKTTLSRALVEQLGPRARLLAHDLYYRDVPEEYRERKTAYNFDEPAALDNALLAEHLRALRAGKPIRVPNYDFRQSARTAESTWQDVDPTGVEVVIVEGILLLAVPELRACLDHAWYVHTPDDVRLVRRLRRDIVERGNSVEDTLTQYMATVRPMHNLHVEPSKIYAEQRFDGEADLAVTLREMRVVLDRVDV